MKAYSTTAEISKLINSPPTVRTKTLLICDHHLMRIW